MTSSGNDDLLLKTNELAAQIRVMRLAHGDGLPMPTYQTEQSAGLDLLAAITENAPLSLPPWGRALVPTGLCVAVPTNWEAQVRPRSGLALKHGVTVLNSPGTIDADYRGEVQVILINLSDTAFVVRRGERIAQLVFAPIVRAVLIEVAVLDDTTRGIGGFGSTGKM